jgi:hypothetical protein
MGKKISFEKDSTLLERFARIQKEADGYFRKCSDFVGPPKPFFSPMDNPWSGLPKALKSRCNRLSEDLATFAHNLGPIVRRSPLLTEADEREVGHAIKGMRAAIRFRQFEHWDTDVLHDEGMVLGVRRAGESEDHNIPYPGEAKGVFDKWAKSLAHRLELITPGSTDTTDLPTVPSSKPIAAGYRPGTAFIMMWLSKEQPELDDVSNAVKRCFEQFGVNAVRSDDIEHEDMITHRILDQIKTAEFLFGDLTGERPSVYYEIGYAHAIGRRVIMYRKTGTKIHFDLAAYNCPEYKNLSELETKLLKRLEEVTGKKPKSKK